MENTQGKTTGIDKTEGATEDEAPPHPLVEKIEKCPIHDWQSQPADIQPLLTLEETPFTMVESKQQLEEMIAKLQKEREIGVSIKRSDKSRTNNTNRLVQISTRTEDFVVDSLALRESMGVLNPIFSDENILKVMHKAKEDLIYLRLDFFIHTVNLFDVYQGAVLHLKNSRNRDKEMNGSLKCLLVTHCEYKGELRPMVGGWQHRPLPDAKVQRARLEAHYLLHIKDNIQNLLIESDLLDMAYFTFNEYCANALAPMKTELRYQDHLTLLKYMKMNLNGYQLTAFRSIFEWRKKTSTLQNIPANNIISDRSMLGISKKMPVGIEQIKECCTQPLSSLLKDNIQVSL